MMMMMNDPWSVTTPLEISLSQEMPVSAWGISPSLGDVQRPQNPHSPPQAPGERQVFRVLSSKIVPGVGDWVLQSDAGHGKELWTAHVPWPPSICDWMCQIKSMDILSALLCSQNRQPSALLLFPHHVWLSNRLVAAGQAGK